MKQFLPVIFLIVVSSFSANVQAQTCAVNISGGNCTGNELTANTSGGDLSQVTWFQYTNNVFEADTISSQSSKSIVAGNQGSGSGAQQFGFPSGGIAVDISGNLYVADMQNNRIQKWAPGAFSGITVAGGKGAGSAPNQLFHPNDVFVDGNGNIYIADGGNSRIQKWVPGATEGITVAGGNGAGTSANQLNGPRAVYVDAGGNILVGDTYNYRVQLWKAGANTGVTVAGGNGPGIGANQFSHIIDVYADAAKNIYIADANTENSDYHRVQKWIPGAGSGTTVAGGTGTNHFGYLLAIFVDPSGTLYTADNGISGSPVSRIQQWKPGATQGTTVAGGHATGWDVLSYPTGIARDKDGFLYVLDGTYSPRVQKYELTNGVVDNTYAPTQPGQYSVKVIFKNGCTATSPSLVVRAKPATPDIYPVQPKGNSNLCDGGTHTYFVNEWDDITQYKWIIPASCSLVSDLGDSVVISVPAGFDAGKLRVRAGNSCGKSDAGVLQLRGRPVTPGNIKGPRQVNAYQTGVVYSVADASSPHEWKVPEGAVIIAGQGSASITVNWGDVAGAVSVNAYNDCGASPFKALQVALISGVAAGNAIASNKSIEAASNAIVFPNPVKNTATITFNSARQDNYMVELLNMQGMVLMQKKIVANKGANSIKLDMQQYAAGIYIIHIKNADGKIVLKVSKE